MEVVGVIATVLGALVVIVAIVLGGAVDPGLGSLPPAAEDVGP